jgi:hypothetical protein
MSAGQPGFWDVQDRLRELSAQGDPLEKLARTVDFGLCPLTWCKRPRAEPLA